MLLHSQFMKTVDPLRVPAVYKSVAVFSSAQTRCSRLFNFAAGARRHALLPPRRQLQQPQAGAALFPFRTSGGWGRAMTNVQAFALGMMVAWTPSLVVAAILSWRTPVLDTDR
jgi:hypothetical protein